MLIIDITMGNILCGSELSQRLLQGGQFGRCEPPSGSATAPKADITMQQSGTEPDKQRKWGQEFSSLLNWECGMQRAVLDYVKAMAFCNTHMGPEAVYMNNGSVSGFFQVPRRGLFLFLRRMFPTVYLSRVCIGKASLLATR